MCHFVSVNLQRSPSLQILWKCRGRYPQGRCGLALVEMIHLCLMSGIPDRAPTGIITFVTKLRIVESWRIPDPSQSTKEMVVRNSWILLLRKDLEGLHLSRLLSICSSLRWIDLVNSFAESEELKLSVALADDDKSQLADTFENLWQAHSRADNLRLPRRRSGGAQEWCSQGETNTSLSSRRDANPRPKSALSSQNRRPLSATCHDFQGHLLRDSRQAECNENCTLPESKCTGESREQRCHL